MRRIPTTHLDEKSDNVRKSVERLDRLDTAYQADELEWIRFNAESIVLECEKWIKIQDDER